MVSVPNWIVMFAATGGEIVYAATCGLAVEVTWPGATTVTVAELVSDRPSLLLADTTTGAAGWEAGAV